MKDQNTRKFPKFNWILVLPLLIVIIIFTLLYLNEKNKGEVTDIIKNDLNIDTDKFASSSNNNNDETVSKVSKHILIDTDEQPTIMTVTDPEGFTSQGIDFYKNVKKGYKILVYSDLVIIYDPEQDIVINMAHIDKDKNSDQEI